MSRALWKERNYAPAASILDEKQMLMHQRTSCPRSTSFRARGSNGMTCPVTGAVTNKNFDTRISKASEEAGHIDWQRPRHPRIIPAREPILNRTTPIEAKNSRPEIL
jgi:PHP family Zn ribbon phosphoesterase